MTAEMKFSVSGSLASMGCALPYAVGAKLAFPDRPVIAVLGDGAMQMAGTGLLIAIADLSKHWKDKRFVILVLRNRELSQVTWEQRVSTQMRKFAASQNIPDFSVVPLAKQLGNGAKEEKR
jgi:pyruvate dehydrogenase (quinone)